MAVHDFLDAICPGDRAAVSALNASRSFTTTSERVLLGAIMLDDAGLCRDDILHGTTVLLHDDQDVCDCVHDAVAEVLGDDVTLLMHGTWFDAYDEAVNDGTPVVIVTFDRAVVLPQDALLLADRVVDLGDVGRPEVVATLIGATTGAAVHVTTDEAASLEAASLMRCVQFAASGEDARCRVTAWLQDHRSKDLESRARAAPRVARRTNLKN